MKIKQSAENYLETIYILKSRKGNVRSIDIVNELEFTKPSVSIAMKNLRENGYITMDADGMIMLTALGEEIAVKMYERHTVISDLLIKMGVEEKTAMEDACRIEHIISEQTFEAMKKYAQVK